MYRINEQCQNWLAFENSPTKWRGINQKSPIRVKGKTTYLASTLGTLRNDDLFIAPHASNCRRTVAKGMMHQKVFTLPLPAPARESGFGLVSYKGEKISPICYILAPKPRTHIWLLNSNFLSTA